jgi:hypothetical protein
MPRELLGAWHEIVREGLRWAESRVPAHEMAALDPVEEQLYQSILRYAPVSVKWAAVLRAEGRLKR